MPVSTCVFDAYGTLFDVAAAARAASAEPGFEVLADIWPRLAADWRDKQLQYTWLRAVTGEHVDFWSVTQDGLDWAMEAAGLDDRELRERLLALYWELPAYAEVPAMLAAIKEQRRSTAILSNGSPDMLQAAVDSAGIAGMLDFVLSVEEVGVFKPSPQVYGLVEQHLGSTPAHTLFVSANGWDAACGQAFGFPTVWINRLGVPIDRLPERPAHVMADLTGVPDLAERL